MPLPPTPTPLAQRVKAETAAAHRQAEALLLPVLQTLRSQQDYVRVLQTFFGFFQPLEERIRQHIASTDLPDISERRSSQLLLLDLATLNAAVPAETCTALPAINNTAQAFGALYVLEGSTLGGKMIARMLRANEALSLPVDALHFFSGYKEQTGPMWTAFLQAFNQQTDVVAIIDAANETFEKMHHWMQKNFAHESAR